MSQANPIVRQATSDVRQATSDGIVSTPHKGVQVELTIPGVLQPGQGATWQLNARHTGDEGSAPFGYSSNYRAPWQVALTDADGNALAWAEPIAECEAYGTAYLEPGESIGSTREWDLRAWDAATDSHAKLTAGIYSLTFLFETQDEETGRGGGPTATHHFTVASRDACAHGPHVATSEATDGHVPPPSRDL